MLLENKLLSEEPPVVVLPQVGQDVEIVVPQNTLRQPRFQQLVHKPDNTRTVRPTISQVSDKN